MTFEQEMHEQGVALSDLAAFYQHQSGSLQLIANIPRKHRTTVIFTGMGSSLFAAYAAADYLNFRGKKAFCWDAFELMQTGLASLDAGTTLVAISQSGGSPETVATATLAARKSVPLIVITNNKNSELAHIDSIKCWICAGNEENSTTKTYTNTIALTWLVALALCGENAVKDSLARIAHHIDTLTRENLDPEIQAFVHNLDFAAIIGSGASYATASQGQLLFEEAARTNAARYTTGQFIHGPVERIDAGYKVVLIDTAMVYRDMCDKIIEAVVKYKGQVLHITNRAMPVEKSAVIGYPVALLESALSPLLEIIPLEKMVIEIGRQRHFMPGLLRRTPK
jgi:glutamine---fructose-6-phosphate transaminase (isomerizing)